MFSVFGGHFVWLMHLKQIAACVLLLAANVVFAAASPSEVTGSAYQADIPFPQFLHLWSEGWALKDKDGEPMPYATANMPLGAYLSPLYPQRLHQCRPDHRREVRGREPDRGDRLQRPADRRAVAGQHPLLEAARRPTPIG